MLEFWIYTLGTKVEWKLRTWFSKPSLALDTGESPKRWVKEYNVVIFSYLETRTTALVLTNGNYEWSRTLCYRTRVIRIIHYPRFLRFIGSNALMAGGFTVFGLGTKPRPGCTEHIRGIR